MSITHEEATAQALAAYRDISAGRTPTFDLNRLPEAAVIAAALVHGDELYESGRVAGYRGFSHDIAEATAWKARYGFDGDR